MRRGWEGLLGVVVGSPLLVDGTCGEVENGGGAAIPRRRPAAFQKQGSLNDASLEIFGEQETLVVWRRGWNLEGRSWSRRSLAWCSPWRGAAARGDLPWIDKT